MGKIIKIKTPIAIKRMQYRMKAMQNLMKTAKFVKKKVQKGSTITPVVRKSSQRN